MGARGGAGAAPAAAPAAGPTKHIVLVKGVSNDTSIGDVIKLFSDPGTPKNVEMKYGEAVVEFHSHAEAMQAMLKDKSMLGRWRERWDGGWRGPRQAHFSLLFLST